MPGQVTAFLQAVVFGMMLGAMLDTFIDIERSRGKTEPLPDGLMPVNRRIVDAISQGRL